MKTIAIKTVEIAKDLALTIELRKELEKKEKELKDQIRLVMGDDTVLEAGNILITTGDRTRSSLDQDALQHDMGHEFVLKYTKVSHYQIMTVMQVNKAKVG